MSSAFQYSVFKTACNVLNAGAVPPYTPSNDSIIGTIEEFVSSADNWIDLAILLLSFFAILVIVGFIVFLIPSLIFDCFLKCCLPSLTLRTKVLTTIVISTVSCFGVCTTFVMDLYKIEPTLAIVFIIPFYQTIRSHDGNRLVLFLPACFVLIPILVSIALTFTNLHLFPQTRYTTCSSISLFRIGSDVFNIIATLSFALGSFFGFLLILNAEKLFIVDEKSKTIGYSQKKGKEWVEVYFEEENKEAENPEEKKKLIIDV